MENNLFNEKTINDSIKDVTISKKQKNAAKEWITLLEDGKLEDEKNGYRPFQIIILGEILGYSLKIDDLAHERDFVDFTYMRGKEPHLMIEAKGTKTKDLLKLQDRKNPESPKDQLWRYMSIGPTPYGIVTNYQKFILLTFASGNKVYYEFDFLEIKNNPKKLEEFVAIFSKKSIDNNFASKLKEESEIEDRKITNDLYKIYHETRLMMIKEFEYNGVEKRKAIHFAQLFLNRLMFVLFAEDIGLIDKRILEKRIVERLRLGFKSNSEEIAIAIYNLFEDLDKGSDEPKIFGFNGGLFKEIISRDAYFKDIKEESFFSDCKQEYKFKESNIKIQTEDKRYFNQWKGKVNPIIKNILLMASYNFNTEIKVNILGHIFEQSISDIENLQNEDRSRRKKEGIYYTPDYITEYICKNTIIPYLSEKGSSEVSDLIKEYSDKIQILEEKAKKMKILDPACGSGAFLIKATEVLFEIFKGIQDIKELEGEYHAKRGLKKRSNIAGQSTLKRWNEKEEIKKIIENNIFGVDINEESVEITKLSLFLKLVKRNKKLPILSDNIKKGNSLIDDEETTGKELAFNWEEEFPFKFDVVIGNPPYVRHERLVQIKNYLAKHYTSYNSLADLYTYFIEKGINLTKDGGSISFILPNKFLRATYGKQIRDFIVSAVSIRKLYNFNDYPVFEEATTYPIILFLDKKQKNKSFSYSEITDAFKGDPLSELEKNKYEVLYDSLTTTQWSFVNKGVKEILDKINENSVTLKKICNNRIFRGVSTGKNDVFIITDKTKNDLLEDESKNYIRKIVTGKEVKRYSLFFEDKYLLFIPWEYKLDTSKKIKEYLLKHKPELEKRPEVIEGRFSWWCLSRYGSKNSEYLFKKKIIYPRINKNCNFYLDQTGEMSLSDNNFFISSGSLELLAILNSKVILFYLKNICPKLQGGYLDFRRPYIETIPIKQNFRNVNLSEKADQILKLNKEFQEKKELFLSVLKQKYKVEKTNKKLERFYELDGKEFSTQINKKLGPEDYEELLSYFKKNKEILQNLKQKINDTDEEIDKMVYKLYDLTPEEIKIVEDGSK